MCWMQVYTYHICIHITYIMVLCRYHNKYIYSLYNFVYNIYNYILYLLSQFMNWQTSCFYLISNGTINMGRMLTFCLFWDRFSLFLTTLVPVVSSTSFSEIVSCWTESPSFWLSWQTIDPQVSLISAFLELRLQSGANISRFVHGCGNLNAGPHDCSEGTLTTEPFPCSQVSDMDVTSSMCRSEATVLLCVASVHFLWTMNVWVVFVCLLVWSFKQGRQAVCYRFPCDHFPKKSSGNYCLYSLGSFMFVFNWLKKIWALSPSISRSKSSPIESSTKE